MTLVLGKEIRKAALAVLLLNETLEVEKTVLLSFAMAMGIATVLVLPACTVAKASIAGLVGLSLRLVVPLREGKQILQ